MVIVNAKCPEQLGVGINDKFQKFLATNNNNNNNNNPAASI